MFASLPWVVTSFASPSAWPAVARSLSVVFAFVACAVLLAHPSPVNAAESPVEVTDLTVDYTTDPLGIDNPEPRLGWKLRSERRGEVQTGYHVQVAETLAELESGVSSNYAWDTTVDPSDPASGSVSAVYQGEELMAGERYVWRVSIRDGQADWSDWSAPGSWEMGLLAESDWHEAEWITPQAATDAAQWTDYALDVDFTIDEAAVATGVVFRAQNSSNFYMWQINVGDGTALLRPHVRRNGEWDVLDDGIDVSSAIPPAELHSQHHLQITADGATITTSIDGTEADSREDDTFSTGGIGFRSGAANEDATFDNLAVHDLSDNSELFADDFETAPDAAFPGAEIGAGELRARNGALRLISMTPSVPLLRKEFTLGQALANVASARAYVYGLGLYELRLSGSKVGDRVLTPPATRYGRTLRYQTYDVTSQLQEDGNALAMTLAEGYGPRFSKYGWRWLDARRARVLLRVTFKDGDEQYIKTDDTWRWGTGPIYDASIYGGETFDARFVPDGWDEPDFDVDASWGPVANATSPAGELVADTTPPVRVVETLQPVAVTEPQTGVYVFDFGQNMAGWARLHVEGDTGTTVRLRYAEELAPDGLLDPFTNRNAAATDTYVLSGDGAETYEPSFTYHGFRYVELTTTDPEFSPTGDTLEARAVHADMEPTASFSSSEPLLNKIYANNRRTIANNAMGTPTDTPTRDERTQPGMDVRAYGAALVRDFGADRYLAAYVDQIADQWGFGDSPDMNAAHIPAAWLLYERYGDLAALARAYPQMKDVLDNYLANAEGYVWPALPGETDRGFGDWCPPVPAAEANGGLGGPDVGGYEDCFSEVSLVNTAIAYRDARTVAKAARALGEAEDGDDYDEVADQIADAFEGHFANLDEISQKDGTYGSGRQVTSILPLAFGMVPDAQQGAVASALVDRILTEDAGHLDTGIFGTRFLLDALVAAGRPDVALTVLTQTTYPSYGYQIGLGATTAWEQWIYRSSMITHDHAMFAGINASFLTKFAGIEPIEPGYAKLRVAPATPEGLEHVSASLQTVRGEVSSAWHRDGDSFELQVTVPANAAAEVHVPTRPGDEVLESGELAAQQPGVELLEDIGGHSVYGVGAGTYSFTAAPPPPDPEPEPEPEPDPESSSPSQDDPPDATPGPRAPALRCHGRAATIVGTTGVDRIFGTRRRDVIMSLGGHDRIATFGGNDLICAGPGNDVVVSGGGNDVVLAQAGRDLVRGGAGRDFLFGGSWSDVLVGGAGADILRAGPGRDLLIGGRGRVDVCDGQAHRDRRAAPGCERRLRIP